LRFPSPLLLQSWTKCGWRSCFCHSSMWCALNSQPGPSPAWLFTRSSNLSPTGSSVHACAATCPALRDQHHRGGYCRGRHPGSRAGH
jgi:hypothetical protein